MLNKYFEESKRKLNDRGGKCLIKLVQIYYDKKRESLNPF